MIPSNTISKLKVKLLSQGTATASASVATILSHRLYNQTCKLLIGQPSPSTHPSIIQKDEVSPGVTKAEFKQRRDKFVETLRMKELSKRHVVIIPSHDRRYMADGVPFIYRQHSNMRYLSGFLESESALVFDIDQNSYTSTLFVRQNSKHEDLWEGYRSGIDGALELTGVDNTDNIKNLQTHVLKMLANGDVTLWYNKEKPVSRDLHDRYLSSIHQNLPSHMVRSAESVIDKLRLYKSLSEINLMKVCGDITAEMFAETIAFTSDHPDEHQIFAKLDYECRMRGANNLAYLPVVAGGQNALTVHYIRNDSPISDGDMVLVDCGCDLYGYVSDVTRTWPVNGRYTEAQRQVHEAVEEIFHTCLQVCKPYEYSLNDIFSVMLAMLAKQLIRLGVVDSSVSDSQLSQLVYEICPHHVGHWLGMDVHDTPSVSRTTKLEPNMIICIEPGIYFKPNDVRVKKEFRGLGIRIEDDILITADGYENLNSSLPTSHDDIELLMSGD